jgi:flagellar biosynthetic protein FlhB
MAEGETPEAEDRSESATPRRIERAREDGQVALSREASGFAAMLAASLAIVLALPPLGVELLMAMRAVLARGHELAMAEAAEALLWPAAKLLAPIAGSAGLGALAATLLQTRGLVSAAQLAPRLDKLNPWAALKRIFGMEGLTELLRSVVKLGVVGAALWSALDDPQALEAVLQEPAVAMLGMAAEHAARLVGAALAAFAALAVLDLLWVRFRHLRMLRMTRQELREEMRDSEGDPHFRAKRRQMRESRARHRMMAEVPRAAVVVTNPTHFAVALAYGGSEAAPKIVAKGVDAVAARIRAAAEEAGVPLVANPPLARALYRIELGAEIPADHYQAVAEIIAFVWRRRGAAAGA